MTDKGPRIPFHEPELTASDGTVRKQHYGSGRQPWDDIVAAGWGPHFAAGNVLKYIRRASAKNGADDVKKARWYYEQLMRRASITSPDWREAKRMLDHTLTRAEYDAVAKDQ